MKAMKEREQKVASELEEARLKKIEAEQKEKELEQDIKEFESQKSQMLENAREEISDKRKEWMEQLRNEITDIRSQWVEAIEKEKETFLTHLKQETGNQVVSLIQKVLSDLSERNLQQQTADFFFEKFENLDQEEKERLRKAIQDLEKSDAEIVSTFELDDKQKSKIKDLLDEITHVKFDYDFQKSKELGFGLEVHIGGWRLGWNLESYLEELRRNMDQYLKTQTPIERSTQMK